MLIIYTYIYYILVHISCIYICIHTLYVYYIYIHLYIFNCFDFALQVIRGAGTVVKGIFDAVQKAAGKSQES